MQIDRHLSTPRQTVPFNHIAVLGAGAWGTALAAVALRAGAKVSIWGRSAQGTAALSAGKGNPQYLPGIDLPPMQASTNMAEVLRGAEAVLLVTPSHSLRKVLAEARPHLTPGCALVLCAKGIEQDTGFLMTQLAEDAAPGHPTGVLSGPTFATETARGYPTAATIAFPFHYTDRLDPEASPAARLAVTLGSAAFRPYVSDDPVGVEVAGAVKNVIAIACGMMTGAGFAENTRAALITRGMDEMKALAEALGGRRETVTGLAGAGDLTLTCSSTTSRNMALGVQLGQGTPRAACFDGRAVVVEGERNARSVRDLARRVRVPMPIVETVHAVLHEGADLRQAFADLWARPIEAEPRAMDLSLGVRDTA